MPAATYLDGKVAAVTGGANGLGAGAVATLTDRGAQVFSLDLATSSSGSPAVEELKVDVCDAAAVDEAFESIVSQAGTIDVLVNCHGVIQKTGSVIDTPQEEMRRVMSVNFDGMFTTCRAASKIMSRQGWGRIVNTASDAGRQPWPDIAVYCASKAAVISFTQALAMEVGPAGITANAICPGVMVTNMTLAAYEEFAQSTSESREELMRAKAESIPVRRLGTPEDFGELAAWLASPASAFMTGALLNLTGGENFF